MKRIKPTSSLIKAFSYKVCRELKSNSETEDIFVIMLTSNTRKKDYDKCMKAGANAKAAEMITGEMLVSVALVCGLFRLG